MSGDLFILPARCSNQLRTAIDDQKQRPVAAEMFDQLAGRYPNLGRLFAALAVELRLATLADEETLRQLAAEHHDGLPDPPLPEDTGDAWRPDDVT